MTNGEKTTFWSFLINYSICIPLIQRDYAQGRIGKEELRKRFITSLRKSILEGKPLHLDFAYGRFSGSGKGKTFYPLDGQQRLTTLWLLHCYVAYKAKKLPDAQAVLQRFSYATRVSARDFCKNLCKCPPLPEGTSDILIHIQNQNWFYSSWNQDPTIQSMLRMISDKDKKTGIVELLDLPDYVDAWKRLTSRDCKMEFRVLDIAEIGQTDDLYVKMNARGKELSSFENFKAELVDYIHKKAGDDANPEKEDWKKIENDKDGFGQKLDNAWTDIFWGLKSDDKSGRTALQNHIDEIFFAFFNRFFFNCQALDAGSENWNKSPLYRSNDETLAFSSLKKYCIPPCSRTDRDCGKCESVSIPLDVFKNIQEVLDRWPKLAKILVVDPEQYPNPPLGPSWEKDSFFFLPDYVHDKNNNNKLVSVTDDNVNEILAITNITIKQRAVFFAICQWLLHNVPQSVEGGYSELQKILFRDWLRVVWNIVENSDTEDNLCGALKLIEKMAEGSTNILDFLAARVIYEPSFTSANEQIVEEQRKARLIYNTKTQTRDQDWDKKIRKAEGLSCLKGKIDVLFQKGDDTSFDLNWFTQRVDLLGKLNLGGDFLLQKVLLSHYDAAIPNMRLDLSPNKDSQKRLLTDTLKVCFTDVSDSDLTLIKHNSHMWINDLTQTDLLDKRKGSGREFIVSACDNRGVVLWGTGGTRWDAWGRPIYGNVILGRRRELLTEINAITGEDDNPIKGVHGTKFVAGLDIRFKYNGKWFRWLGLPDKPRECDVYLLEGDAQSQEFSRGGEKTGQNDKDEYYCFVVEPGWDADRLKKELEALIQESKEPNAQQS